MSYPNTKRPLIGLVSSRDGGKMMMNLTYMNSVWYAGGLPVILAYTTDPDKLAEYAETFDGFLFSGGVDVDPVKYGEEKMFDSVEIDSVRDEFEEALFKAVYPTGKPILGICRGIQSINVWMVRCTSIWTVTVRTCLPRCVPTPLRSPRAVSSIPCAVSPRSWSIPSTTRLSRPPLPL